MNSSHNTLNMFPQSISVFERVRSIQWIFPVLFMLVINLHVSHSQSSPENIALNQTAWLSSLHYEPPNGGPQLGVDGDLDPEMLAGGSSCFHTTNMAYPWFAVDLGSSRFAYRVDLTNRRDAWDRAAQIRIGVTETNPTVVAPTLSNYDICHSYPGPLGSAKTQGFYCGASGRYLIVQLAQTQILNLCEVQVYETMNTMELEPTQNKRLTGHAMGAVQTRSKRACVRRCLGTVGCTSLNYEPTTSSCELVSCMFNEEAGAVSNAPGWVWYSRPALY